MRSLSKTAISSFVLIVMVLLLCMWAGVIRSPWQAMAMRHAREAEQRAVVACEVGNQFVSAEALVQARLEIEKLGWKQQSNETVSLDNQLRLRGCEYR